MVPAVFYWILVCIHSDKLLLEMLFFIIIYCCCLFSCIYLFWYSHISLSSSTYIHLKTWLVLKHCLHSLRLRWWTTELMFVLRWFCCHMSPFSIRRTVCNYSRGFVGGSAGVPKMQHAEHAGDFCPSSQSNDVNSCRVQSWQVRRVALNCTIPLGWSHW